MTIGYDQRTKGRFMARHKTLITYLGAYFFAIGTTIRFLSVYRGYLSLWTITGLLAAFFLLLMIEPWLTRRSQRYTHLYLAVQTGITIALFFITPNVDFFAVLFMSLTLQAVHVFPSRTGFRWIGLFTVVMAILMFYGLGWGVGLPLVLTYTVAYFLIGSHLSVIRRAETAREGSQKLLAELQAAHRELQVYTAQAEELAALAERKRAQEALEAVHAFQQAVIDGVAEPIMVIGIDYRVRLMNRAAREFSSGSADASEPKPPSRGRYAIKFPTGVRHLATG